MKDISEKELIKEIKNNEKTKKFLKIKKLINVFLLKID